ncbi:MAG: hypothetical protein ACE5HR_09240 [bacterium]
MNKKAEVIKLLVKDLGKKFSASLGIDLTSLESKEIFKWFLASILFGARISETIVVKTYREFEKEKILSVEAILRTGWDGLVEILDRGGYVRYDFKTATKLLEVMGSLKDEYGGDLNTLHEDSLDSRDLERRTKNLGKGIGEVTVGIFLRELRGLWEKADPPLSPLVLTAMRNLMLLDREVANRSALRSLKFLWERNFARGRDFADLEVALLRLGKDWCRRGKCKECRLKKYCPSSKSRIRRDKMQD